MEEKFRELILEVCCRSRDDEYFGAVKFNKLLFFTDLEAYKYLGRTISGQEYQKLELGPAPKRMLPVLEDMAKRGDISTCRLEKWARYSQQQFYANREPNHNVFTPEELDIIGRVIKQHKNKSGSEMTELSHKFLGWQLAEENEIIPLSIVFISDRPLTIQEKAYAKELIGIPEYVRFRN